MPRQRSPRWRTPLCFAALALVACALGLAWQQQASSLERRDRGHAHLTVRTAATLRWSLEHLEELAGGEARTESDPLGLAWLDEESRVQTADEAVEVAALDAARNSIQELCRRARTAGRARFAPSPLDPSLGALLAIVPRAPGAGFLLGTRTAAGIPPGALAREIRMHGVASDVGEHLAVHPSPRSGELGVRSSLEAPPAVARRFLLLAFAALGVGFFGLLSARRRDDGPQEKPSAAAAPPSDLAAFQGIPYPILIHHDGCVAWSNPAASRALRRASPFALLGSRIVDWLDAGQEPLWREHLQQLEGGGRVATSELVFRAEDGLKFEGEVRSVRVPFDGRPAIESVIHFQPPTSVDRSAALDAGRIARGVLDALDDGVLIVDRTGALNAVNARAEELLGYSAVILQRMDLASLCPAATREELARLRAAVRRAERGERVPALELDVRRRDGRALPCTLWARPIGVPGRIVLLLRASQAPRATD